MPLKSWPGYDMTYREFMKRHRLPNNELLSLLWSTSEEWQKAVGNLPPGMHHMLVSTFEIDGKLILDSPIDEKRARKWHVKNGYEEHHSKKRQKISQAKAAKWIGVSEKTISRWEKEKHTPIGYPGRDDKDALEAFAKKYKKENG